MKNLPEDINELLSAYNLPADNTVLMRIYEQETIFYIDKETVTLPVGFELISQRYFKHTPPIYDDIEYAINYIEDEIEKVVHQIPYQNYQLISDTPYVRELAHLCFLDYAPLMLLQRQNLERLFGEYAEIVTGRPPQAYEPDISPKFYAQLLILREYMHHLKFTELTILKELNSE